MHQYMPLPVFEKSKSTQYESMHNGMCRLIPLPVSEKNTNQLSMSRYIMECVDSFLVCVNTFVFCVDSCTFCLSVLCLENQHASMYKVLCRLIPCFETDMSRLM